MVNPIALCESGRNDRSGPYFSFALALFCYFCLDDCWVPLDGVSEARSIIHIGGIPVYLNFFIHGTPTILYKALRYSWAWKHVGVIEFILRHERVDRYSHFLNAYHNWPGFFTLNAFFTESVGLKLPLDFAMWAPFFFGLANAALVYLLADSLSYVKRLKWMATFVFVISNWIGQDYFAPQAIAFFHYLLLIVCIVRWFRPEELFNRGNHYPHAEKPLIWRIINHIFSQDLGIKNAEKPNGIFSLKALIVLLIYASIVVSHQLTPIMTLMVVFLLVITGRCYWKSLPIFMGVMLIAWNTMFAGPFFFDVIASEIEDIGRITENADKNLNDTQQFSQGLRLVAQLGRFLTVSVGILAVSGTLRRFINRTFDVTILILAMAPIGLVIAGSYGGEVLFRVYLFMIPFLSFLVAALFFPTSAHGRHWTTYGAITIVSCLLFTGYLFAYFGKDKQYYFSPDEISAAEYLYTNAPANSLLIEGSKNYPSQFINYENFFYVPISRESPETIQEILDHPVEELSRWMSNDRFTAAYLLITSSQKAEIEALGVMPKGGFK